VSVDNGPSQALVNPTVHFGRPDKFSLSEQAKFNPIRWLAQRLIRGKLGSSDKSGYELRLEQIAQLRRQQRLEIEARKAAAQETAALESSRTASKAAEAEALKIREAAQDKEVALQEKAAARGARAPRPSLCTRSSCGARQRKRARERSGERWRDGTPCATPK
jgi:hypothetical protein